MNASHPSPSEVNLCRLAILGMVASEKLTLAEAVRAAKRQHKLDAVLVDAAYAAIRSELASNTAVQHAVTNPATYEVASAHWYIEPSEQPSWSHYRSRLEAVRSPALDELHSQTTDIVSLLANPLAAGQRRKGLVMGNVQSGKTRSFAGVAAKAADAGYKLVIVLAGMHDNLRDQTQSRLDDQLFDGDRWYPLTTASSDFQGVNAPEQVLKNMPVVAAVVKKNTHRLGRLVDMLRTIPAEARSRFPVLIVDDEADQASPNSLAQRDRISAINGRLRDLWSLVGTGTYLGYTATPFANVLIDPEQPEDLFPSDFITTIPPGDGYFGAQRVFGISETVDSQGNGIDGLDMVRGIPDNEATALRPPSQHDAREAFDPIPPDSLNEAIAWFVVATAIRRAREQRGHSSMLVHTTHYTAPHRAMRDRLEASLKQALARVSMGDLSEYRASWDREALRVSSEATLPLPPWEAVATQLETVVADIEVIMDNGASEDRLNYDDDRPRTVIAVGGGTLSRGLTLEGLVVSYFTRTSNAYDTLLQMGRWFGYRPGYEDLPRVWVTKGLDDDYAFLARVEQDLRVEIESVQGSEFTPAEIGVRVRVHPGRLQVTAANKMWAAKTVQLGLSDTSNQTFILIGSDPTITERNIAAVEALVSGAPLEKAFGRQNRRLARKVLGSRVSSFLADFTAHEDQRWLSSLDNLANMQDWIQTNAAGPVWNVLFAGNSVSKGRNGSGLGTVRISGADFACLERAPLVGSTPERLDFKAITSPDDRIADIDPVLYASDQHSTDVQRRRIRRAHAKGEGLVIIYPISGQSSSAEAKRGHARTRMDMPGSEHVIGFAIYFPAVDDSDGRAGTFVSVRTTWDVPANAEGDEDEIDEYEIDDDHPDEAES